MGRNITVYFDLETGGLELRHPIIQLAAVAVDENSWSELGHFEAKLHFDEAAADPQALRVNHYARELWERVGQSPSVVAQKFADFITPFRVYHRTSAKGTAYTVAKLAGHNAASFDGPRLRALYERYPSIFLGADPRYRCTLQQAMFWFDAHPFEPEPVNFKLETLCRYFDIEIPEGEKAHDALTDVRLTVQLARRLRDWAPPARAAA